MYVRATGGSVKTFCQPYKFDDGVIVSYTWQMLNGIAYMHDQQIVHRDLKGIRYV
jgi:serine/threonine protein kinase